MPKTSYKCEKCKDTGWILGKREDGTTYAYSCSCRKKAKIAQQWRAFGIDLDSVNCKFSNFKVWNKISEALRETSIVYINDFSKIQNSRQNSLLLCGQPGCGKTHIAVATAINLISLGVRAVYMPYRQVLTNIKLNFKDEEFYKKELKKYQECELLLIDDLFKGKVSLAEVNIMFEIINYRYTKKLPMIISSERIIEEMLNIDEAIGSRIYEMCKNYIVTAPREESNNYRLRRGM